jgi:hypothetical protein
MAGLEVDHMERTLTETELARLLVELEKTDPDRVGRLRAHLEALQAGNPLERLIAVVVDPVWRDAVEIAADHVAHRDKEMELERRRIAAYEARTAMFEQRVIPYTLPAVGMLLLVLVAALAVALGVRPDDPILRMPINP